MGVGVRREEPDGVWQIEAGDSTRQSEVPGTCWESTERGMINSARRLSTQGQRQQQSREAGDR